MILLCTTKINIYFKTFYLHFKVYKIYLKIDQIVSINYIGALLVLYWYF